MLDPLALSTRDTEELLRRGLNHEQMHSAGFKTWPGGVMRVPCMRCCDDGQSDSVRWYGRPCLLIPARNAEGLITGLHVKPHRDADESSTAGKYMWASINRSFRTPRGGFPIFCCWYDWSAADTVALVEGGLKPCIFAHLAARMKVIGASGGQFWQSEWELLCALARMQAKRVILFPDAGAVKNFHVLLGYFRSFEKLSGWGIEVQIAWWGQEDKKEHLDADDLLAQLAQTDVDSMSLLSVSEFFDMVPGDVRSTIRAGRHAHLFINVCG